MRIILLFVLGAVMIFAQPKAYVPMLTPLNPEMPASSENSGMVRVLMVIDEQGKVTSVEALAGPTALRPAALELARKWRFHPVLRDGRTVSTYSDSTVAFMSPDRKPPVRGELKEEMAAFERLRALAAEFPRSKAQVLADLEQDVSGTDAEARYPLLASLGKTAWTAGDTDKTASYARELLSGVAKTKQSWNDGNALHDGNMLLGMVELKRGNSASAVRYLLEAGKTSGSPQLNSFGPNMMLADALVKNGEKTAVLEYFEQCRRFWKMGGQKLDDWTASVRGGGQPAFGANLMY